jgi:hypothetical protein
MAAPIAEAGPGFKTLGSASAKSGLDIFRTKQEHHPYRKQKSAEMERKDSFRVGRRTKEEFMLAVFATLTFLTTIWLCMTVVAGTLEQSWGKVIAALAGRSLLAPPASPPIKMRVSQRYPSMARRPVRAQVELRAAA